MWKILYLTNLMYGFEDDKYIAALFVDLSKMFHRVSYDILIEKLKYYGIRDVPN